jgi:hypothetical protein
MMLASWVGDAFSWFMLDLDDVGANGQVVEFGASIPAGVQASWSSSTERSYFAGLTSTATGETVETDRGAVTAGVDYSGVVGLLPGGLARVDGQLSVSSFVGSIGLDRSVVSIPIQADMPRGSWWSVFSLRQVDGSLRLAFERMGLKFGAGVSSVLVQVRVE